MNIQQLIKFKPCIPMMHNIKQIHFVGIGGAGMCGIAKVLLSAGYKITGSDLVYTIVIKQLIKLGVVFFLNHNSKNIDKSELIIVSSAINDDNPEIIAAKKANIPIISRGKILAELMRFHYGIAIAGTHGKTTTTAMITNIYFKAGLNPTFINGGLIKENGIHAHLGCSHYLIVEADESDASLLHLNPIAAVITNIESDHMDTYQGNFENLKLTFTNFLHNLPFYGYAIICIDDPVIRELQFNINLKIITYGFSNDADLRITNYHQKELNSSFILCRQDKSKLLVKLNVPGRHNALNAVAAIAVATKEGIDDNSILQAMLHFQGASRRFDSLGYYKLKHINGKSGEVIFIDDYGHHPTEIYFTIKTVRAGWPDKRLVMIFQPHRFTRTRDLYYDFINVLSKVDVLLILEIYSAGEKPISGINSNSLCNAIRNTGKINPILISDESNLPKILSLILQDNDLILTQGAGTIGEIALKLAINKL